LKDQIQVFAKYQTYLGDKTTEKELEWQPAEWKPNDAGDLELTGTYDGAYYITNYKDINPALAAGTKVKTKALKITHAVESGVVEENLYTKYGQVYDYTDIKWYSNWGGEEGDPGPDYRYLDLEDIFGRTTNQSKKASINVEWTK